MKLSMQVTIWTGILKIGFPRYQNIPASFKARRWTASQPTCCFFIISEMWSYLLSFAGWIYEIWRSEEGRIETVPTQSPTVEVQSISHEDAKHPHLASKSFCWQGLMLSLGALEASENWAHSASVTPFTQMKIMTWQAKSIFIWSLSWDLLPEVKDTGQYPSVKLNNL